MLVAKQVTVTTTPVELLAGEDTSQTYALLLSRSSGVAIGGPDVGPGHGADLFFPVFPMIVQGESFWAIAVDVPVDILVMAYSTPGE